MGISERIKELRTGKKLTQSDLATEVGLTYV
ncbi:MAG: transcriptional regulator, partial [Methanosarcina mazei]